MKNLFKLYPTQSHLIPQNPTIISSLLYIYIIRYHNAKIIGHKINANAWEILLAMLIFESIFGLSGLIAAPIFYAYLKLELKDARLI